MTTPAYVTSAGAGTADAGGTSQSSGNVTPSGSNLIAIVHVTNSDGTPANPSSVTFGGNACTQLGSTLTVATSWKQSVWYYKNPATSAAQATANWGSNQGERLVQVAIYSGVDQTTPFGTPVATAFAGATTWQNTGISAAVGDLILDFVLLAMGSNPDTDTAAPNSAQTERIETVTLTPGYDDGAIADLVAGSTSETRGYKTLAASTPDGQGMISVALKGASAADTLFAQAIT